MNTTRRTIPAETARARVPALLAAVAGGVRELRAERSAHRQLRRELATYSTPAEIADLLAAVDTGADESAEVRTILNHQLQDFYRSHRPLAS
jgi:hypothetical protein